MTDVGWDAVAEHMEEFIKAIANNNTRWLSDNDFNIILGSSCPVCHNGDHRPYQVGKCREGI